MSTSNSRIIRAFLYFTILMITVNELSISPQSIGRAKRSPLPSAIPTSEPSMKASRPKKSALNSKLYKRAQFLEEMNNENKIALAVSGGLLGTVLVTSTIAYAYRPMANSPRVE